MPHTIMLLVVRLLLGLKQICEATATIVVPKVDTYYSAIHAWLALYADLHANMLMVLPSAHLL